MKAGHEFAVPGWYQRLDVLMRARKLSGKVVVRVPVEDRRAVADEATVRRAVQPPLEMASESESRSWDSDPDREVIAYGVFESRAQLPFFVRR